MNWQALKGCNCSACRKARHNTEVESLKEENRKLKEKIEQFECETLLSCEDCMAIQSSLLDTEIAENKKLEEENEKLKKENEQFKCKTFLYCNSCESKKNNKQLKEEIEKLRTVNGCKYLSGFCSEKDKNRLLATENAQLDAKNIAFRKENEKLKKEILEFEIQVRKLKSNWCSIIRCEELKKLKKENELLLKQKILADTAAEEIEQRNKNIRFLLDREVKRDTEIKQLKEKIKLLEFGTIIFDACQSSEEIKRLKEKIKKLKEENEQFKCEPLPWFQRGCKLKKENEKLKEKNEQLTLLSCENRKFKEENEKLKELNENISFSRDYWSSVIKNCRKLMPSHSESISLVIFIRSILDKIKQLERESA